MARILAVIALFTTFLAPSASAQSDAKCIGAVDRETIVAFTWAEIDFAYLYGEGERQDYGSGDICDAGSGSPEHPLQVDIEITGLNDPDASDSPTSPDLSCVLPVEPPSQCSVTMTTSGPGMDILAAWIDLDGDDSTVELDTTEGPNEGDVPGSPEPDATEVVSIEWINPECADGTDNDGDGNVDHPDDPDCSSERDHSEETHTFVCSCAPPQCRSFPNMIIGTSGDDELKGTPGRDCIAGAGGDDLIYGRGGNDLLLGNGGNDLLHGGRGHDDVRGNGGDDSVMGARGNDVAYGGPGIDEIRGGTSEDHLRGGGGGDAIVGGRGGDQLRGQDGNDELVGGRGRDDVRGGPGRDSCSGEVISTCE